MKPRNPNLPRTGTDPDSANVGHVGGRQTAKESDFNDDAFKNADTLRLVALLHHEKLALEDSGTDEVAPAFDPYNSSGPGPEDKKPRKSIDDLRKLSAKITKAKKP